MKIFRNPIGIAFPTYSRIHRPFCKKSLVTILYLSIIGNLLLFPFYPSLSEPTSASIDSPAEKHMIQGLNAFRRGSFEQAILDWKEAVKLYEKDRRFDKQGEALTLLAQAYQYIGQYNEALKCLKSDNVKNSIREKGNEKLSLSHPFLWAPFVLVGEER